MIWQFLSWYLVIQLITIITIPLGTTLFGNLPDRGYAFVKSLGILLIGFLFWLGYSYGLLRNETGGAWLAVILVAVMSATVGRKLLGGLRKGSFPLNWRNILFVELLFLVAFAFWAYARAHDPAVDHTEEPMDLMFMNSIWISPTFPPHDAWLSGYAISYYYFGYWLLTTLGRLAGQPPEIAYTLGQASWYGLLWIGCFGVVYNLLAYRNSQVGDDPQAPSLNGQARNGQAVVGGLLAGLTVALAGNPQGFFEWLHARGTNITWLARWFDVTNFPAVVGPDVDQTGLWHVSFDWWWWRASRVISDRWLDGSHMEVIDEFPFFSYLLGDNHPHVIAMPIVLLVIAMALNLFLNERQITLPLRKADHDADESEEAGKSQQSWFPTILRSPSAMRGFVQSAIPLGIPGALLFVLAVGSLVFLNTWDFPFYFLLVALSLLLVTWRTLGSLPTLSSWQRWQQALTVTAVAMVALVVAFWLLLYPYLLTAQSQAGGIVPNLFNPTRFPQFLLMFGFAIWGVLALLGVCYQRVQRLEAAAESPRSAWSGLGIFATLAIGVPLFFILLSTLLVASSPRLSQLLSGNMPLPEGATSYVPFIVERWGTAFWTFLFVGLLVSLCLWVIWRYLHALPASSAVQATAADGAEGSIQRQDQTNLFVLLLVLIGLLLVYAPEFVYLRDNFATRMNTVFKFYYQAWLLFGLGSSYIIVTTLGTLFTQAPSTTSTDETENTTNFLFRLGTIVAALLSLVIVTSGLFYPAMAIYSKTGGFDRTPTFNSVAYLAEFSPNEWAAIEWVQANTAYDALVLEGKGSSYRANYNRVSTITGRQTLMGWDGHQSQWRGNAFGEMAAGRDQALDTIYRGAPVAQIRQALETWQIDYVYVGPVERNRYEISPQAERNLAEAANLVFEAGDVRIYQRRK